MVGVVVVQVEHGRALCYFKPDADPEKDGGCP